MSIREPTRPLPLTAVFWLLWAANALAVVTGYAPVTQLAEFVATIVASAVLWFLLPWDASASPWRKLASPCFLVAVTGMSAFSGINAGPFMLITLANIAFLFSIRMAVVILTPYVVAVTLAVPLLFGDSWISGIFQGVGAVILAGFVYTTTRAFLDVRRAREAAERLLERVRELAVAEERARMARDMHDSIGHHLTVIKIGLENAERFRERRPDAAWHEVRQAKQLTVTALADARLWVRALRPLALESRIGGTALQRLADSFTGTGLHVDFQLHGTERPLDPDAELVLYRVLQEGLTNAVRHADAKVVRAQLTFGERDVVMTVGDDGKGARGAEHGFGLTSLRERVHSIGGALSATSGAEGGFELRVEIPAVLPR
ncbi:sensor histidine kinase [Nonomuraea typhae]|uniref:histidine kinase n=1 Tax=Nonomuraea typhae TaxID=2603600 RepID=A0ABW7Z7N1_9ACTN